MRRTITAVAICAAFSAASPALAGSGPGDLLPQAGEIAGWATDGEPLFYGPEDLWEYIDGSAENFLSYEFEAVAAQEYRDDAGRSIKVEIYRHASPLMAYGIFTQFRSPDADVLEIGDDAFGDAYSLHLLRGRCYVKIDAYDGSPESAAGMRAFAGAIAARIDGAGAPPAALDVFPPDGLVAWSETFINEGVLGSAKFPPAFVALYAAGEKRGKLYLFPGEDDEAARTVFDWYTGSIGAAVAGREGAGGWLAAAGSDRYRGDVLVFLRGGWLGIVTGFEGDPAAREDLASRAVERIAAAACEKEP
ncbi:MAG: hypothetical protein JW876_01925 [Candidatus Krumholzibacteriota bacterium]|nr:hypothetical protein [Candidatus Krumholzibacteriota bacterium]